MPRRPSSTLTALAALAILSCLGQGCYERTLRTRGIGGYGTTTRDPYRSETKADKAVDRMMGEPERQPAFKHAPGDATPR